MNKYMFSVVISTYNRAEFLTRALRSLVAQTYANFEVIVCDDGSTDQTKEVVESFKNKLNIKYIWEENYGGPARPKNNGIKAASGEWICFLDDDDWWYPNKLEIVSKYLNNGDIIYHDLHPFNPNGKKFRKIKGRKLKKPIFNNLMTQGNALATSSVVVKKDILNIVGLFDEDKRLVALEDYDAWLRISRKTDNFCYIREVLGAYWLDGANIYRATEEQFKRIEFLYGRHLAFLSHEDRRLAEAIMSYRLGAIRWRNGLHDEAINLFKVSKDSKNMEIKIKSYIFLAYRYLPVIFHKFIKI